VLKTSRELNDYVLLHLVPGSERNGANVRYVLDVLNAAYRLVSAPAWSGVSDEDCDLEQAVHKLWTIAEE